MCIRDRQNRMTILCIVLAVFLVTAVFSMADMATVSYTHLDVYKRQGFSLAALAGHDQHLLRLGRRDQKIAEIFLQGQNVLRDQ